MTFIKKIAIATVIIVGLMACGGRSSNKQSRSSENSTEHNHNTHTHADGTVHSDHAPEHDTPQQESFKVEADSVISVKHDHSAPNHKH